MEPRIQYAKTSDGVSIAIQTVGQGAPIIVTPPPFGHIELEWRLQEFHDWYERLAQSRMMVKYDRRGTGLSDREVTDYSLEALVLDLEAVVDSLGLETVDLFGVFASGPVCIAYAAHHPERVSHLILWCSFARGSDLLANPQLKTMVQLMDKDWTLFTETLTHAAMGWPTSDAAHHYAELMRQGVSQEAFRASFGAMLEFDVGSMLPMVRAPTLVLHRRGLPFMGVDVARGLASRITNARLAMHEGAGAAYALEDSQAVLDAIDEFLGQGEEAAAAPPGAGAFRTVLFTDVEGSTALTQRLGDAKARALLREHERMVREALKSHGGAEVKTTGDGFMTSFSSATRALECAVAMQRAFAARNESAEEPIKVRVGLNAGEPIAEEAEAGREDLFGTAVIMAARIAGKAKGGEILASEAVRQIVAGKGFFFADRGEEGLHGFEEPVRLYEVRWQEEQ